MSSSDLPAGEKPLRVFDVINDSINLALRQILPLLSLWAIAEVPRFACDFLINAPRIRVTLHLGKVFMSVGFEAWFDGFFLLIYLLSYASAVGGCLSVLGGGRFSLKRALLDGAFRYHRLFMAAFFVLLMALLGFILLVVPGVIVAARYYLVYPAIMTEELRPFQSMKRSSFLTQDHRFDIAVVLIIQWIITFVLAFVNIPLASVVGSVGLLVAEMLVSCISFLLFATTSSVCYTRLRQAAGDASEQGTPDVSVS